MTKGTYKRKRLFELMIEGSRGLESIVAGGMAAGAGAACRGSRVAMSTGSQERATGDHEAC